MDELEAFAASDELLWLDSDLLDGSEVTLDGVEGAGSGFDSAGSSAWLLLSGAAPEPSSAGGWETGSGGAVAVPWHPARTRAAASRRDRAAVRTFP